MLWSCKALFIHMRIIYLYKALKDQILSSKFARLHDSLLFVFWGNCSQKRPSAIEAKVNNRKLPYVTALKLPFWKRVWICAGWSTDPCSFVVLNSILEVWHIFKPVLWSVEASPDAGICRRWSGVCKEPISSSAQPWPYRGPSLLSSHLCWAFGRNKAWSYISHLSWLLPLLYV